MRPRPGQTRYRALSRDSAAPTSTRMPVATGIPRAALGGIQPSRANLSGADLRGADLRGVNGMTPDQIRAAASTHSATRLGGKRVRPQTCGPPNRLGGPLEGNPEPLHPG
ncbi:pentapeptide repeat-containing protein [Nonomuraea sp. NPDC055795]